MRLLIVLTSVFINIFAFSFDAKILKIKGEVLVDNKKAQQGDELKEGQVIQALGSKSFFVGKYSDGTKFLIKNGKLKIEKIKEENSQINLIEGTIFVKVKPLADKTSNYEKLVIKTRTASMGVRGTMFYVTEEKDNSYLCVCEGIVEARDLSGAALLVNKYEDINIFLENKTLEKRSANKQMISMGEEVFNSF